MPFPAHSLPKCPSEERSGESSGKLASDAHHHKHPARRCKKFFGGQQQRGFPNGKLTRISTISANLFALIRAIRVKAFPYPCPSACIPPPFHYGATSRGSKVNPEIEAAG
jgi:hypothetical protein